MAERRFGDQHGLPEFGTVDLPYPEYCQPLGMAPNAEQAWRQLALHNGHWWTGLRRPQPHLPIAWKSACRCVIAFGFCRSTHALAF